MGKPLVVTCAVIEQDGEYLMTDRPKGEFKGMWEFPGGKYDEGDGTLEVCVEREINEELGIIVEAGSRVHQGEFTYQNGLFIELNAYECKWLSGGVNPKDGQNYKFIQPEHMNYREILKADWPIVRMLQIKEIFGKNRSFFGEK